MNNQENTEVTKIQFELVQKELLLTTSPTVQLSMSNG